jgi:hypothetical protein
MTPVAIPQTDESTKTAEELKKLQVNDDAEKKEAVEEDDDDDDEDDENAQAGANGGKCLGWLDESQLMCRWQRAKRRKRRRRVR